MEKRKGLRRILEALADLVWPKGSHCLVCGDPRRASAESGLCPSCEAALMAERVPASACHRCLSNTYHSKGCPFCAAGGLKGIDQAFAPFRYRPNSRQLVISVKFRSNDEAVPYLARWMAQSLWDRDFDLIIPVPLHQKRLKERGVNQAAVLSKAVSALTGIPCADDLLIRVRETRPQAGLDRQNRAGNVRGAFEAVPGGALKGKRVLIVDDVRTTGATASACAKALRDAGCEKVCLLTACCTSGSRGRRFRQSK